MIDNETIRLAAANGMSVYEAAEELERRGDARTARLDAEVAKMEARAAEIEGQYDEAITPEMIKKVTRKIAAANTKAKKEDIRRCLVGGDAAWQRLANPQTREAAIASLSLAEARKITGK